MLSEHGAIVGEIQQRYAKQRIQLEKMEKQAFFKICVNLKFYIKIFTNKNILYILRFNFS